MKNQTEVAIIESVKNRARQIGATGNVIFKVVRIAEKNYDNQILDVKIAEKNDNFKRIRVLSNRNTRITNQKTKKSPNHLITRNRNRK